jgi:hypothetical protein
MSQPLPVGWTTAFSSPDETTRAEARGAQPPRCFRTSEARTERSRRRGRLRGYWSRRALKALPPIGEDEP